MTKTEEGLLALLAAHSFGEKDVEVGLGTLETENRKYMTQKLKKEHFDEVI